MHQPQRENMSPVRSSFKAPLPPPLPNSPPTASESCDGSLPVRPVTARTWQAISGGAPQQRMSVYTNDLYGQGGGAAEQARPQSPQYRPTSARPVTPRSAERLQQQLVGSPKRSTPDRISSPSRLQMSTANVPLAPPKLPTEQHQQQAASDSLQSLLARAAKAVAEDAAAAQQRQEPQEGPASPRHPASGEAAAAQAEAERPATAPTRPGVGRAPLQTPRLAAPTSLPGARDSPRAALLFQNFAGAMPAAGSPRGGNAAAPNGTRINGEGSKGPQQRPSTPSFQPISTNRPATAMPDFTIKSGMYNSGLGGGEAGQQAGSSRAAAPAASALAPPRAPYPVPPSTAPAKADLREAAAAAQNDGMSSFGIISGAFVAAAAPGRAAGVGSSGEIEECAGEAQSKAALKAMLQSDMLAAADIADKTGLRRFLLTPGPSDKPLQCKIYRTRSGLMKSSSQYVLVLEDGERFLVAGRKRKSGAKGAEYTISVDQHDLSHKGSNFFGKLRSNFVGTEFVCYDDAHKPRSGNVVNSRSELAAVTYQTNVLGTKGPRKMTVLIPKLDPATNRPLKLQPKNDREGMLARYKQYDLKDVVVLRNKPPKWNDTLNAYCLNFSGRVTQASVKNFQLVSVDNMERIILQFGKVGSDVFTMDYAYPMTAMQAFAICLSSFDSKLACE